MVNREIDFRKEHEILCRFQDVHPGYGSHPDSYSMGTAHCFHNVKAGGAWNWSFTSNYSRESKAWGYESYHRSLKCLHEMLLNF